MSVGKRDIEIVRGDDYTHVVRLAVRSGNSTVPIDITGRTYTAQIRQSKSQTTPDATFVCVVTDGPNGEVTISLGNAVTSTLRPGCYHWDLQQNASGVLNTIIGGKVTVLGDVTR